MLSHAFTKRLFSLPNVHFVAGGALAFNTLRTLDLGSLSLGCTTSLILMVLPGLRETENPLLAKSLFTFSDIVPQCKGW